MEFDQEMIECLNGTCPPDDAETANCKIYRAVETNPATDKDFLSYVKRGMKEPAKAKCDDWGLSVWRDLDAVEHARNVIPHFQERYIAAGEMGDAHGVMRASPSRKQPQHFTFWTYFNVDLVPSFEIIMPPVDEEA
ncbi:hypothetical protein ACU8OJ_21975 [Rhizobium leguminosarum]